MSRFIEHDPTSNELTPLDGYLLKPLVSLEESLKEILPQIDQLEQLIKTAIENCRYPNKHNLTKDESAALYLYSIECGTGSFYRIFNQALRSENRSALVPWFSFLKLFHTALNKLPVVKGNIWRGLREDVSNMYYTGLELTWWSVNSCSLSINIIKHFLGPTSTLFLIEAENGRNMSGYTKFENENEVILPPGTRLRVVSNALDHDGGLHVIHTMEITENKFARHQVLHALKKNKFLMICGLTMMAIVIILACLGGLGYFNEKQVKNKTDNFADPGWDQNSTQTGKSIFCHQWGVVRSCARQNCTQINEVHRNNPYISDCYTFGDTMVDGPNHTNKWFRLNSSYHTDGYVSGLHCSGSVGPCESIQ
ncbi:unnamed protein product [Adineta ricciae]|uniref:NAD(P)(+)--arginine ADP-ribosyltransferase n=1 Tax=Adineta ricciae TaxID=249248 RepID=A0A815SCM7_ADIRI|nr:unnamed protein product [Adineta ricciae]